MSDPDDSFEALWSHVIENWDNPKAHDAYLQFATQQHALGQAARQYRTQLVDEHRKQVAQEKLNVVAVIASQVMEGEKTEPTPRIQRGLLLAAVVCCVVAIGVLFWAIQK